MALRTVTPRELMLMPRGYAGKFLEVNLSTGRDVEVTFPEEVLEQFVGGRGLAAKLLWDRLGERWETVDPLGPENLLLMFTGPMSGFYPGARLCVSGKSPQCNGVIGSTVAGEFPVELKCAGYDGIILSGKAGSPVYLLIKDDEVELRDAGRVWGLDGKGTVAALTKEVKRDLEARHAWYGKFKEPAMLYIGSAGEHRSRMASVMQKWSHAAGYGGYGAVMGSKNLKAVTVKGTGPLPDVHDLGRVVSLVDEVSRRLYVFDNMRRWGTGYGGYTVGAVSSSEPIRNWQEEWHDEKGFGVDKFDKRFWVKRYWADYGCPMACMKLAVVRTGVFKGAISDTPDYELQAYLGTNLGVFDPAGCVHLSDLIDDLGFCGIQAGNVLGFAAELYQRGILTREDLGGLELRWGDARAFAALARMVALREGIGDVLAEGTYRAALKVSGMKGVDVMPYAVQVKGVAVGAHGTRSGLDMNPIGYACSAQAGDHTGAVSDAYEEMNMVFADSAVTCSINSWRPGYDLVFEFLRAVTGWETTRKEWCSVMGPRIVHIQRAALLLGGPDAVWKPLIDDDNPARFYEPLASGPQAGHTTDRASFEELRGNYYQAIGWDERGVPKSEVLEKLGLDSVDRALGRLRR